jgi:uncharacterized protein (TIRG00374 family)
MMKQLLSLGVRAAVTIGAFWLIFNKVDFADFQRTIAAANPKWLILSFAMMLLTQAGCIIRWWLLAPKHPKLTFGFLSESYLVGNFFSAFLPTTIGGDVIRSYDLIKATGEWKEPLASVLIDRLIGIFALMLLSMAAWAAFPPVREDPVMTAGFLWLCGVVLAAFGVLTSRRVLNMSLKPFGKIGLGQLQSHAKQFQEALLAYRRRPKLLLATVSISLANQVLWVLSTVATMKALNLGIPVLYLFLIIPIVALVSQIPISLNGWGLREGTTVLLFQRVGIEPHAGLTLALIGSVMQLTPGVIGGFLFLARQLRRKK